jgi:hypothetical protein
MVGRSSGGLGERIALAVVTCAPFTNTAGLLPAVRVFWRAPEGSFLRRKVVSSGVESHKRASTMLLG